MTATTVYRQRFQLHWPLTQRDTRAKKPEDSMTSITVADLALHSTLETKLDWLRDHPPQAELFDTYQTDVLPNLSVANVRTLLRAAMPLP